MKKFDLSLYFVTNSDGMEENAFLETIDCACDGGVTLVQLREKNLTGREYYERAIKVKAITDRYNIPLIIDDRLDIAMAVDAAGIHLGQTDLPIAAAKKIMGADKITGATAKTVEQAKEAEQAGADYIGVGAMYPTKTKVITVLTPVETLQDIVRNVKIPIVAIGGLDTDNLDILQNSGAKGIAVVRAITESAEPKKAAQELLKKWRSL